jgi:hypothetical protein
MTSRTPGRVRLYLTARRAWTRAIKVALAVFDGVWLGILDRRSHHWVDEMCFRTWREYSTDAYNLSGLREWEKQAVERHFPPRSRILLIGAGGGREVVALHELGFDVDAYECNPDLVAAANRLLGELEGPEVRIVGRDEVPEAAEPCDGAVVGWGAYMLVRGKKRRVSMLEGLRRRIMPGGPVLLSFYVRAPAERRFRLSAAVGNVVRLFFGNERVEVGDGLAPNFVHHFTETEIKDELEAAGFELVCFETSEYGHAVGRAR